MPAWLQWPTDRVHASCILSPVTVCMYAFNAAAAHSKKFRQLNACEMDNQNFLGSTGNNRQAENFWEILGTKRPVNISLFCHLITSLLVLSSSHLQMGSSVSLPKEASMHVRPMLQSSMLALYLAVCRHRHWGLDGNVVWSIGISRCLTRTAMISDERGG